MNQKELNAAIARDAGVSAAVAGEVVKAMVKNLHFVVARGGSVNIYELGRFARVARAVRFGRNPNTGDVIRIPAKKVVKYAPAAAFVKLIGES